MLRFDERQRAVLEDKVPDLANVAAGALIFGQVVGGASFSWIAAAAGAAVWLGLLAFTLVVARQRRER